MDPVSKAQSSTANSERYRNLTPYKPGQSGNPSGRPKDAPFTKLCKKLMRSKVGRDLVKDVMNDVLAKRGMASVLLLREIGERTDGKVTQEVAFGERDLSRFSDGELAEKLVKLDEELSKRIEVLSPK